MKRIEERFSPAQQAVKSSPQKYIVMLLLFAVFLESVEELLSLDGPQLIKHSGADAPSPSGGTKEDSCASRTPLKGGTQVGDRRRDVCAGDQQ